MRKYLFMLLLSAFAFSAMYGQETTIKGKVVEEGSGLALENVSVQVSGTQTGTKTGADGSFSIKAKSGAKLVFSFVGYKNQTVSVTPGKELNVIMEKGAADLDEYVVIGYQSMRRKDVSTSVSSVSAKDLKDIPLSSAAEAITGRLAGVQVTTTEGRPGADVQIRVRGGSSITQDNSPLYIVDGIQVENALSILSPQEIETIDVLKDAASTAIYGARGANGVVLITTKGGKEMKTQVTYNGFAGVRKIVNKLPVMNPYDYVKYQHQIYNLNTNEETRNAFRDNYGTYEDLELYKKMPFMDWQDEIFGRDAFSQTHALGVTGGTKTTSFNLSVNHTDEEGIMLNSGFQRTLAAFKFDHKVSNKARTGFNARYSRQKIDGVGTSATGTQSSNRLRNAVRFRPYVSPGQESFVDDFDPDYANQTNLTSPVVLANQELRYDYRNDINVNGYFSIEPIKGLTLKTVLGIANTFRKTNAFNGVATSIARQNANLPVINMTDGEALALTNTNTIAYKTRLGDDHSFDFLLGQEIWQQDITSKGMTIKWLPADITPEQAFAGIQKATPPNLLVQDRPTTAESAERLMSFFGRANYSYKGRYLATFSLRRDGSSKFAKNNRSAIFPSASFAWKVSEEAFMDNQNLLTDLKLRVSMGTAGNNRIPLDLYKTMFAASGNDGYAFNDAIDPGFVSTDLANANLKWESTVSRNFGLDFTVLKRINASVDVYFNTTSDLLLKAKIPSTSGYSEQYQNVGKTANRGVEVQLGGTVMRTKDFTWNANFNISFNKNTIKSLGIDPTGKLLESYLESSGWITGTYQDFLVKVGDPIGQFYGYLNDGFYKVEDFDFNATTNTYTLKPGVANSKDIALGNRDPQPGDLKLKKTAKNGTDMVSDQDRTILGNAQPKFIGGLNQQFVYKGFDASIFMNFSVGNKVYNANKIEFTTQYLYRDNNMLSLMNDRWKSLDENGVRVTDPNALAALNANTKYWTPAAGQYFLHSFAIEDGSFLRLSNVTLGYSLPQQLLKKTKAISQFRVYATVNNLLTLTGYSGYDPEANTRRSNPLTPGVDYAAYPRSRYILAGVNVTF